MSAALIKAKSAQQETILEPPSLIKGSVTPVRGRISVTPKMLRLVWKRISEAAAAAEIE